MPFALSPPSPGMLAALLGALAFKHFVADFLLQTTWMARGKERPEGWTLPLLAHIAIHAVGTLIIALVFRPDVWWLALVDLVVHGAIDRGKTLVTQATHWPISDERFWWLLGFDQFLHQATNVAFALVILSPRLA